MENPSKNSETPPRGPQHQSDSQKAVRRHLEDENHVISEDDIRNVRVGVTPDKIDNTDQVVKEIEEEATTKKGEKDSGGEPITPWDVIND